jgi:hypothetical protein
MYNLVFFALLMIVYAYEYSYKYSENRYRVQAHILNYFHFFAYAYLTDEIGKNYHQQRKEYEVVHYPVAYAFPEGI